MSTILIPVADGQSVRLCWISSLHPRRLMLSCVSATAIEDSSIVRCQPAEPDACASLSTDKTNSERQSKPS